MITSLFLLTLSTVNAAENAFQALGITLPQNLMSHITAIYDDNLYVFGGRNASSGAWNDQFWKLSLSGKFSLNAQKDDVVSSLSQVDWETLTVTAPAYGDSVNNEFICDGQCSVVIAQYLYIVGPYSSTTSTAPTFSPNWIYRLDLSQSPNPVFSAQAAFTSNTLGYSTTASYPCVTSVNDIMYTISGVNSGAFSTEAVAYDPPTQTSITDLDTNTGRFNAACVPNADGSKIYLVGGRGISSPNFGVTGIDSYDIAGDSWTNNPSDDDFDTNNGNAHSRIITKCFTSPYTDDTFECVGGQGQGGVVGNSIIWNYETGLDVETVTVPDAVFSAGVETYEFVNLGQNNDAATIVLVTGGGDVDAYDTIQYAVRYTLLTDEPTAAPIKSPTLAPTKNPVVSPTAAPVPSASPTKAPSVFPSQSPTTDPTTDPAPRPTSRPTTARPTHAPTPARGFGQQLSDAFGGKNPDCHDTWVACNSLVFILLLVIIIVFIVYWILGAVWYKRRQDNRPLPPTMGQDATNVEMGGGKTAHTTANKWKSAWELEQEAKTNANAGGGMGGGGPVGDVGGGW